MKKILVVDDEKSIVKGIKFSLEQDDMKVEVAYDGETALELAKANHYDMILLDIMLPRTGSVSDDPRVFGCANHYADS